MLTEKTFDTGTVCINYAEGPPSGKPLVLLHGVTGTWQGYLPILPAFLVRYHIFAVDLRGHGNSGRTPGAYMGSDHVADIVDFLRAHTTEPAALIGHSLGGLLTTLVAAQAPDLVAGAVLIDPPLSVLTDGHAGMSDWYEMFRDWCKIMAGPASPAEKRANLAARHPESDGLTLRIRFDAISRCDLENLTLLIEKRMMEPYRLHTELPKITCPVLLLQSEPDMGALDDETAQTAVSLLADCIHIRMPGVGHGIHEEQPGAFVQMACNFLETL